MRRSAFTLVEMLASTVLATLLMMAVLAVVASIGRTQRIIETRDESATWPAGVMEMVRFDLLNARDVKIGDDRLVLSGFGSLDAATLEPTHRPVEVEYRLRQAAGVQWLVRAQTDLDVLSNRNRWSQPIAAGVAGFDCESLGEEPQEAQVAPNLPLGRQQNLPRRLRVTIRPADPAAPTVQEVLVVR